MSSWGGGRCFRCGSKMKLLFSSWYCPCDTSDVALIGYALVDMSVYKDLDNPDEIPKDFLLHIFKDRKVAQEFRDAFIGFMLLQVDLSLEKHIFWSTKEKLWVHEATRNLPCKVVQ